MGDAPGLNVLTAKCCACGRPLDPAGAYKSLRLGEIESYVCCPMCLDALHAGLVLTSFTLALGWFSRSSALLLMLLYAQSSSILPAADRAIDMLLRNVLMILACSRCGAIWSLDAIVRTGHASGDGQPIEAWPRYLIVLQNGR